MSYGMYISAEGAQVQSKRLEFISNNLANLETPGFKRDVPTFQARFAEAIQQGYDSPGSGTQNDLGGGVKLMDVDTDFSHTTLRSTGTLTDFAINGEGFFQLQRPDGEVLLSRAGNFLLDGQGQLVSQYGNLPVLDNSGSPIQLDPDQPFEIQAGGILKQLDQSFTIGLQQVGSLGDLVKVGSNLFRPLGPTNPLPEEQRDLLQGYLEQSGVNSTREMMAMIETTRAFEANTQLIQHQDSMFSALIDGVL